MSTALFQLLLLFACVVGFVLALTVLFVGAIQKNQARQKGMILVGAAGVAFCGGLIAIMMFLAYSNVRLGTVPSLYPIPMAAIVILLANQRRSAR